MDTSFTLLKFPDFQSGSSSDLEVGPHTPPAKRDERSFAALDDNRRPAILSLRELNRRRTGIANAEATRRKFLQRLDSHLRVVHPRAA